MGGAGGTPGSGVAGRGGNATASLYLVSTASDSPQINGTVTATGGSVASGVAGAATALASVTSPSSATASVTATGGASPTPGASKATASAQGSQAGNAAVNATAHADSYNSTTSVGNTANSTAHTTSIGSITANATAIAAGSAGTALAQSTALDPSSAARGDCYGFGTNQCCRRLNMTRKRRRWLVWLAREFQQRRGDLRGSDGFADCRGAITDRERLDAKDTDRSDRLHSLWGRSAGCELFRNERHGQLLSEHQGGLQFERQQYDYAGAPESRQLRQGLQQFELHGEAEEQQRSSSSFTSLATTQTFFTDDPVSLGKLSGAHAI